MMNWIEERAKFYAELRRNPLARMQEQMADMQAEMIPAYSIPEKPETEEPEVKQVVVYEHSDISAQNIKRLSELEIQVAGLTKATHTHTPRKKYKTYDGV